MKWYKKQLDKLKTAKLENVQPDKNITAHKTHGHSFVGKNKVTNKKAFFNPVAARNVNRPKTDSK